MDELAAEHGPSLAGKLIIDATNRMGEAVSNSRASLSAGVRYARAFNTLGGETMADPVFQLWIALDMGQGRGRRLALRLLEG